MNTVQNGVVTLLEIGQRITRVIHGKESLAENEFVLPLGARKTAADYFRRQPPTPYELETAIEGIESIVIPIGSRISPGSRLVTADSRLRKAMTRYGFPMHAPSSIPIESIEALFRELNDAAHGVTIWRNGNDTAVVVLIIREFMHHHGFDVIHMIPIRRENVVAEGQWRAR